MGWSPVLDAVGMDAPRVELRPPGLALALVRARVRVRLKGHGQGQG